jgi:VWFA-related protein
MPRLVTLSVLCLALVMPAVAVAQGKKVQPKAEPTSNLFLETVNVSVVNVDVYVTDKKTGKPATGLTEDDFELLENGKPVKITNFYVVDGGKGTLNGEPTAPLPAAGTPEPPRGDPRELDRSPVPEDQRLRLVVYIDNFNLRPFNRNRVMRELRVFLSQNVKKGDQVTLLTYDRSLKVRRPFTSDPNLIAASMLELEKVSAQGPQQDSERREVLRNIADSQSASEAQSYARAYAESIFNDLTFATNALKETVNSMAGMPGRKAILYVSDGLPMIAGQDAFAAVQEKFAQQTGGFTETFQYDASRRFSDVAAAANANRVTFYAIDAAGLRVNSSISAENAGGAGQSAFLDGMNVANLQSPIQLLAEKTGGQAILNTNNVLNLLNSKIARDFDTYYSLGYTPANFGDGRFYKLAVKMKRKGYAVRHREGYRNKSPETLMTEGTMAALQFGYESNAMGVTLEFGTPTERKDGYYLVPINVRIPLEKVVLVPREGGIEEARVRVFVGAMDGKGGVSEVQQTPVPISIPEAEMAKISGKYFAYSLTLLMRDGEQKVAVGVRDDVAGQSAFVTRGVRIGA